ncbi:MAG: PepSY domain-containing protein [Pseudomonadota bacterium]
MTFRLTLLHLAQVGGMPVRILVCAVGGIVTMLSVTGVYIWMRKRRVQLMSALKHSGMASR